MTKIFAMGEGTNITNSKKFHLGGLEIANFSPYLWEGFLKILKVFLVRSQKSQPYIRVRGFLKKFPFGGSKNADFCPNLWKAKYFSKMGGRNI